MPMELIKPMFANVADNFIDKVVYQLYIATLWANVVLNPDDVGIEESDLAMPNERLQAVHLSAVRVNGA